MPAHYMEGNKKHFIYAVDVEEYEKVKAKANLLRQYGAFIILKHSEAESFCELLRQELFRNEIGTAGVRFQEDR